jgi:flagellar basal-body rod modification protein FlgD
MITGIEATGIGSRAVSSSARAASPGNTNITGTQDLGEDAFLKLLVAELEHQDPLNPMDNNQFITQMATFQSLQTLSSIEAILKRAYPESSTSSTPPSTGTSGT